jgi:predicted nucleic acid-binding protein
MPTRSSLRSAPAATLAEVDVDAFDSDALINAVKPGDEGGRRVHSLLARGADVAGIGSVLLLPEVLSKPIRDENADALEALRSLLSRLELRPVDDEIAAVATSLAAKYRLQAADAVHLATAVVAGATRFITNNSKHFTTDIDEVDVTYPAELPDPV